MLCIHRRSQGNQNLVPFDHGIEAAACRQGREGRRKKRAEVAMAKGDHRVLRDYAFPQASSITSSIINPTIEANNFELNPALITFVEQEQFGRHPLKNPNAHLRKFLAKCDSIKLNGVSIDATKL